MNKSSTNEVAESINSDQAVRRKITQNSFSWFIRIFLSDYIKYDFAPFQEELIYLAENDPCQILSVMAFRNSGKSTLLNLGLVLWSILGVKQKKCVVIVSKTQAQAKSHFLNIRNQLEQNMLLVSDMGPFRSDENQWGMLSLELLQCDAKIISLSREQSIRGIRYNEHRPDLIICDDVEDTEGVERKTEKDIVYQWFTSEIIPAGNENTKIIVLGNLLDENSLLLKLQDYSIKNPKTSTFRAYPILDENEKIMWPEKFDRNTLNQTRIMLSDDVWKREYVLKILPKKIIILDDQAQDKFGEYPQLPQKPKIVEQKPIISIMKKFKIKAPLVYPSCSF